MIYCWPLSRCLLVVGGCCLTWSVWPLSVRLPVLRPDRLIHTCMLLSVHLAICLLLLLLLMMGSCRWAFKARMVMLLVLTSLLLLIVGMVG